MRQPGGGALEVVGDVNDDHMAKGCRMIRDWRTEAFVKSGDFQVNSEELQRRLHPPFQEMAREHGNKNGSSIPTTV